MIKFYILFKSLEDVDKYLPAFLKKAKQDGITVECRWVRNNINRYGSLGNYIKHRLGDSAIFHYCLFYDKDALDEVGDVINGLLVDKNYDDLQMLKHLSARKVGIYKEYKSMESAVEASIF